MNITKIMNNSLVLAEDENKNEVVVMGKGFGFNNKVGDRIPKDKIEKIFVLKSQSQMNNYVRLIEETPNELIEVTNNIIKYIEKNIKGTLNDQIFITLLDHISYAVERYKKNIVVQNRLIWEVKKFYSKEYKIGEYCVEYINKILGIKLPEEEAGNIAFHIVNAETENDSMEETLLAVKMLKDIFNIVQYNLGVVIDKESINYSRFITHVQFFIQRILENKMMKESDGFIFNQICSQYKEEFKCAQKIEEYIKSTLNKELSKDELMYLIIHIVKINNINNK